MTNMKRLCIRAQRCCAPVGRTCAGLLAAVVMVLGITTAVQAQSFEWEVGDVAVATPNGQIQVFDSSGISIGTLNAVPDGGSLGGCAFDSTYRLRCVDFDDASVVKLKLQDPHDTIQTLSVPSQPQSIIYAGAANDFIVGFAGGAVRSYDYTGKSLKGCTDLPVDSSTAFWIDVAGDGHTIFYTSGLTHSRKAAIRTVDLSTCETSKFLSSSHTFPAGQGFFGLRLLPTADAGASGGFLIANGDGIMRVSSTGAVTYVANAGESNNDWRSVWLDPDGDAFWSVNLADGNLYEFNISTGAVEAGPFGTGASEADDVGGIAVEGVFSAALPAVQQQDVTLSPGSDESATGSASFCDTPSCSISSAPPNKVTITLNNLTEPETLTVRFSEIDPIAGTSDSGLSCIPESQSGTECTVWEIEGSGSNTSATGDLLFYSPQTSTNSVLLKNEFADVTTFVGYDETLDSTSTGRGGAFLSVFSQNQLAPGTSYISSGWEPPVKDTAGNSINLGSNIKFQFYLLDSSGSLVPTSTFNCSTATEDKNCPELSLSKLRPNHEAPQFITTGENEGNSGTADLIFRPLNDGFSWGVNLDTSGLTDGCYIATGIDPKDQFAPFSYSTTTSPYTTILVVGSTYSATDCENLAGQIGLALSPPQ